MQKMSKKKRIFIAGDSTASNYQETDAPRAGWGQVIENFFEDNIKVINKAASGRSSRSFINENRLAEIEALISEGDYLLIQFGHNDQKDDPERGTEAFGSFQNYLKKYIDTAERNGATPILLTPVQRRNFSSRGHLINTHGKYPEAIRELAHQLNLDLIDIAKITKKYFEELGPKRTKDIFLWLEPGESENYPDGEEDNTHFSKNGASKISELIIEEIKNQNLELNKYITDETVINKVSDIIKACKIEEVKFKDQDFNILDYGAKKGGRIKNTEAINKAINDCSSSGGGRVIVPSGLYLTGPINFANNVNFHLEKGAIIKFSSQLEDYKIVESEFEGEKNYRFQSPISAKGLNNIAITGEGVIDGSGDQWRPVKKYKMTERQWQKLISSGGAVEETEECKIWWPSQKAAQGQELVHQLHKKRKAGEKIKPAAYREAGEYLRPVLLNFKKCKNILLEGVTFQNSPGWNLHPLMSENIVLRQLTIRNPWYAQNGDGLDLDSCKNVLVEECDFDVGDDAICLKSGKNEAGRKRKMPTENVYIRDCKVYHGHGGFVIGSEMSSGIKNVYLENCDFLGTDIGVRFKSSRGRGGVVENIFLNQIKMTKIKNEAVKFNLFYESEQAEEIEREKVTVETPQFKNIYLKDINCLNADRAIYIKGLPEMSIKDIYFEDLKINAVQGVKVNYAENVDFKNLDLISKHNHLSLLNSNNLDLNNYLIIAADGSGDCQTFSEAVKILKGNRSIKTVFIKKGRYKEKIVIPESLTDLTFVGEVVEQTILTYDDYARKIKENGEEMGTFDSASTFINGDRLKFRNITFVNTAKPRKKVGQALAASIGGDKVAFYNCKFKGNQDTLYTKGEGSFYFDNCYIEGDVDFIFGAATAYFNNCEIYSTGPGYITAASTPEEKEYGYIFKDCTLTADQKEESVFLGRPWRPYGNVAFINSYMGQHIRSEGWNNWRDSEKEKTARYAEYNNYGPGADDRHRSDWIDILTAEETNHYNINKVFTDQSWI